MHHQGPRPRFGGQSNMPRFPAPHAGQQQGPGWNRNPCPLPWGQQRFAPPRPEVNQGYRPPTDQFNGFDRGMNHGPGRGCPPRPQVPRGPPGPSTGPMFRPHHHGATPPRQGFGPPNFPRQPGHNNFIKSEHNNNMQAGFNNNMQPGYNNNIQPGFNNKMQPGYNNKIQPAFNNNKQPGFTNKIQPGFNNNKQPGHNNNIQRKTKFDSSWDQPKANKRPKIDKRELPENNKYFCDTCDRGFKDEDKYKAHNDTHTKCPEPGCVYVAAGKLVQLHIKMQHNAGLAKKIWSLDTPEDIQKWREERKKKFPTAEIIAKKNTLHAEKLARGEVIEEKYFGKMRNNGRGGSNQRGRGRGRGRGQRQGQPQVAGQPQGGAGAQGENKRKLAGEENTEGASAQKQVKRDSSDTQGATAEDSLSMFFGTGGPDEDSDKESEADQTSSSISTATAAGALGNLISTYQDSGEEDGEPTDVNKNTDTHTTDETKMEVNEETKENGENNPRNNRRNRKKKNKKRNGRNQDHTVPMVNKSLLEKLLAKEIRQERNKILQCVHYIVHHRFFEKSLADLEELST